MTLTEVGEVRAEMEAEVPPQRAWCSSYCGCKSKCRSDNQLFVLLMDSVGMEFSGAAVI